MILDGERRVDGPGAGQDRKRYGRILALLLGCLSLFACHRAFEPQAPSTPEPEATPGCAARHVGDPGCDRGPRHPSASPPRKP